MTDDLIHLPELIAETFGGSRSEARRLLAQGGVRLDGELLDVVNHMDVPQSQLEGSTLRIGKRREARLERSDFT